MYEEDQVQFAHEVLLMQFPKAPYGRSALTQFLIPRKPGDVGNKVWRTLNVVQEDASTASTWDFRRPGELGKPVASPLSARA